MRLIQIIDPAPVTNEYLTTMYLRPLFSYCADNGIPIKYSDSIASTENCIALIHGDRLSPELIVQLKNQNCSICSLDINDSSYFSSAYQGSPETAMVDLFFKVSGIPKTNYTEELNIDRNFRIFATQHRYLPDDDWSAFSLLKPKIKPLPYVLWTPLVGQGPTRPCSQRSGKVIIRGGAHFWRVVLFLRLVQQGLNDLKSSFSTEAYFNGSMIERFRFCQSCIRERQSTGRCSYSTTPDVQNCKSPVIWGTPGEFFGGPAFGRNDFGHWNNRCPHSFFWLAKEYERCRGPLNNCVEKALNGSMYPINEFVNDLSGAAYTADLKWLNTIYAPPRFWEAASLGTVNFYPKRTADQDYFPVMEEDVHYITFPNDMTNLNLDGISQHTWAEISNNAKNLYETWIRGDKYVVSTNLLRHITEQIESI